MTPDPRGGGTGPPRAPLFAPWPRRLHAASFVAGTAAAILWATLPESWVEARYSRGLYPVLARASGTLLGWTRISIFEWAAAGIASALLALFLLGLRRWLRKKEPRRRILLRGFVRAVSTAAVVYALFVLAWGLGYRREPLESRHPELAGTPRPGSIRAAALAEMTAANRYRLPLADLDPGDVETSVERGLTRALREFESLERPSGSPPKRTVFLRHVLDWTTTSGFCAPWTHEAHVNPSLPPAKVPFVLAHELAHQAGYPDETEANFLAYLACVLSNHPGVVYSAHLSMVLYYDAAGAYEEGELERALEPDVRADLEAVRRWVRERRGPVSRATTRVYDLYLRAEGIQEGVAAYGRVVRWVTAWRAEHPPESP